MEKRNNRVKVFFSAEDLSKVNFYITFNHLRTNISDMARNKLYELVDKRHAELPIVPTSEFRDKQMLILFSDDEKDLLQQLSEINSMSVSEVVRALVMSVLVR